MTHPTQVTQNPETPTCRQNEAAKSQKPSDSAKQIGEIQKPNNSAKSAKSGRRNGGGGIPGRGEGGGGGGKGMMSGFQMVLTPCQNAAVNPQSALINSLSLSPFFSKPQVSWFALSSPHQLCSLPCHPPPRWLKQLAQSPAPPGGGGCVRKLERRNLMRRKFGTNS